MSQEFNFFDQPDESDEDELLPEPQQQTAIADEPAPAEPARQVEPPEPAMLSQQVNTDQLVHMLDKLQAKQQAHQMEEEMHRQVKRVLEAVLFASGDPVHFNRLREICDIMHPLPPRHHKRLLEELQQEYIDQDRAFRLEETADGWQLRSCQEYSKYIAELYRDKRGERLSHAATESLAIIAYRQPITRPQVDAIRGVDSSGSVHNLLERGLIEPAGKLEGPGRPTLYRTTRKFLEHYGLCDLKDLPPLEEGNK